MFTFDDIDMIWFANLKVVDLKAELKKRGFKGYSKMKKAELQKTLVGIMRAEREAEIEAETPSEEELNEDMNNMYNDIAREILGGKVIIPIEGNEDKVKRMFRDLAMMYHPDRPTGDSGMMAFVNEMKENMRK